MNGTFWSFLPFLIVIPVSMLTKQVLPGLLIGLLIGAYMLHPTFFGGLNASLDYILQELTLPDHLRLLLFLYGFGAFVGYIRVTGGVAGFSNWMQSRISSARGAFIVTWLSTLATFMAPNFRIITVAPVMKQVFTRMQVPASKVAFVIDVTSTPFVSIVPLGTAFVGYMVGLIGTSARHYSISGSAYHLFLQSLPFNFFSIFMLAIGLQQTFFLREKKKINLSAESRHQITPKFALMETAEELTNPLETIADRVPPEKLNLVLPLVLLISSTLFFTWWDGHLQAATFGGAWAKANAARAMLQALFLTLVLSTIWYLFQKQPIQRILFGFLSGGNEMMSVIVLLVLVWSVSAVSTDMGFTEYTERTIGHLVPAALLAPVLFLFGCAISYVIGSSFGTWGMLLPLGYSLAASTHASIPLLTGAVFASGTFGGFASPLSDNTVAMATVMKLPLMKYSHSKLKASLVPVAICTVLYAAAGWFFP